VSTFRLEPEHFHFEIRSKPDPASHDWHVQPFVKDRIAFPPERGEFSPYSFPEGICTSSKPFNVIARAEHCQPLEITGFPPDFNRAGWRSRLSNPNGASRLWRDKTHPPHGMANISAQADTEGMNSSKIAGGSAFRETLQGPCPRMRTPGSGVNLEAY
jgi:hypothetical protein